ncbi:unnamed protein product [Amoebophrya sp. A120]|nr:unnamed protein product [Amoebophrya sp. A120]|eukprot:GSA120T00019823001.1
MAENQNHEGGEHHHPRDREHHEAGRGHHGDEAGGMFHSVGGMMAAPGATFGRLSGGMTVMAGGFKQKVSNAGNGVSGTFKWTKKFVPNIPVKLPVAMPFKTKHALNTTDEEREADEKRREEAKTAADDAFKNVKPVWWRAWLYRNVHFGRYGPFDEEIQRTDIEYYNPPWYIKYTDKFARRMDKAGETMPGDLPPTWCGAITSVLFTGLATMLLYNSVNRLFSANVTLSGWGNVALNVDYICYQNSMYSGVGVTREYRKEFTDPFNNTDANAFETRGCEFNPLYYTDFPRFAVKPYLDVPALEFLWKSRIEFYEEDGKSSVAKVEWKDKNGIHFGGTSTNNNVQVAFAAHEKVPIMFNSYSYGGSSIESPMPNATRYLREMAVTSSTHNFDESLRYAYSDLGLMGASDEFFDHDVVAFVRFDPKQLRNVKSCQVQVGLVSRYQYDALRPYLLKYDREYQRKTMMDTMVTGNWSWHPDFYTNTESGTWRRRSSQNNLMIMESSWTAAQIRQFMQNVAYGRYQVNVERRMRDFGFETGVNSSTGVVTNTDVTVPVVFTDWMLFLNYVNNFQYSAEQIVCDGKLGTYFNPALLRAEPPTKYARTLILKSPMVLWTRPFPFYIQVTGDMGMERMLVTSKVDSYRVKVTRGTSIGSTRLNFKTDRPTSYPPVATEGLWVCPVSRYMDGEFCDCNCGMADPDCLSGTLPVKYCADMEICSPLGRCTTPIYDSSGLDVAVSEPCTSMTMPGELLLNGYIGHNEDFQAEGGNACWVCPYDVLYGGRTSRNENNEYVCQYKPTGDIPAKEGALAYDTTVMQTYGANGTDTTALQSTRIVKVFLGPKAGFPAADLAGQNFTAELNFGQGITELVSGIVSEPVDTKTKTQILHIRSTGPSYRYNHFASGTMVSSLAGDYTDTILQLDNPNQPFSQAGPYRIMIDSSEMQIRTGSTGATSTTTTTTTTTAAPRQRQLKDEGSEGYVYHRSAFEENDAANAAFVEIGDPKSKQLPKVSKSKRTEKRYAKNMKKRSNLEVLESKQRRLENALTAAQNMMDDMGLILETESGQHPLQNSAEYEEKRRRLTTLSSALSNQTNTTSSCAVNLMAERQRLDISGYANGLESAGVKSILARQYTGSLDASKSIYNYPSKTDGDLTDARSLDYLDSGVNTVPGSTNCFVDIYDDPFKSVCKVNARLYGMYFVLQTPPSSSSGTLDANTAWAALTGAKDVSNADVGYNSDSVKEAIRIAIGQTFGLTGMDSSVIKPDLVALNDATAGGTAMVLAPPANPAAGYDWTSKVTGGSREVLLEVKFRTRQWYTINKIFDQYITGNGGNITAFPEATLKTNVDAQLATAMASLYAATQYDANNAGINPKNDAAQGFVLKHAGELADLSSTTTTVARRLQQASSSGDYDENGAVLQNAGAASTTQQSLLTRTTGTSTGTSRDLAAEVDVNNMQKILRHLTTTSQAVNAATDDNVKLYDYLADYKIEATKLSNLTATSAATIAAYSTFSTVGMTSFIYATEEHGIAIDSPNGLDNLVLNTYGQDVDGDNLKAVFRFVFAISRYSGDGPYLATVTANDTWTTAFTAKFAADYPWVQSVDSITFGHETLAPQVMESRDRSPPKQDFDTTITGFSTVKEDKPWCDYSTESGSPGMAEDGTLYLGRNSIFCDGLHDGALIVNYAGFSDPLLVPPDIEMKIIVRGGSADSATPSMMEVRTLQRAYQWLWPTVDATTGKITEDRVGIWKCEASQWSDGVCDCNCGRADWDCMGDKGMPERYVTEQLDNPNSPVAVNINCPDGDEQLVPIPELASGSMPPTCGQIKANPDVYAYCQYKTGLPTSIRENAFTYEPDGFNGTSMQKAPDYLKYLWEVLELDCPLIQNRDMGTVVETLGVTQTTENVYKAESRAVTEKYVDQQLLTMDYDTEEPAGEGYSIDPACLVEDDPPPFCAGGAVEIDGTKVQTQPVVRARTVLTANVFGQGLAGGAVLADDLLRDEDVITGFQNAFSTAFGVKSYEIRILSFTLANPRQLSERWKRQMEMVDQHDKMDFERLLPAEKENIARIKQIRNSQLLSNPEAVKRRRELSTNSHTAQKLLVQFEIAQRTYDQTLKLYSKVKTTPTAMLLETFQEHVGSMQEANSLPQYAIYVAPTAASPVEARIKRPDNKALEQLIEAKLSGMTPEDITKLKNLVKDIPGFDQTIFEDSSAGSAPGGGANLFAGAATQAPAAPAAAGGSAGASSNFATCFDECCFKPTDAEMASCAQETWKMTSAECCPNGRETRTAYTSYTDWGYISPFDDPFYVEPGKCCYGAESTDLATRNTCCTNTVGFQPCCKADYPRRERVRRQLSVGPGIVLANPESEQLFSEPRLARPDLIKFKKIQFSQESTASLKSVEEAEQQRTDRSLYDSTGSLSDYAYNLGLSSYKNDPEGSTAPAAPIGARQEHVDRNSKTVDELFKQLASKYPWMKEEITHMDRKTQSTPAIPDALSMAENLRDVYQDKDFLALNKKHGIPSSDLRSLGEELPHFNRPLTEKEIQKRLLHAEQGNNHRRRLREAVLSGELNLESILDPQRFDNRDQHATLKNSIQRVRAAHKMWLQSAAGHQAMNEGPDEIVRKRIKATGSDSASANSNSAISAAEEDNSNFPATGENQMNQPSSSELRDGHGRPAHDLMAKRKKRDRIRSFDPKTGRPGRVDSSSAGEEVVERPYSVDDYDEMTDPNDVEVTEKTTTAETSTTKEQRQKYKKKQNYKRTPSLEQLQTDWMAIEREFTKRNYRHMLAKENEDVLNYKLSQDQWRQLNDVVEEYATTMQQLQPENFAATASAGQIRRFLTVNSTNTTTTTWVLNQTDCTKDWTDESNWPPNARITDVPQCAHGLLSQAQLEQLGFFDQIHLTAVTGDVKEAVSQFAASVAALIPSKKVVSFVVQTISQINLFRDASATYLPRDRSGETPLETFSSPTMLDAHVAMFVMPRRVPIADLCPSTHIANERLTNFFGTAQSADASFWDKLTFHEADNLAVKSCKITPFKDSPGGNRCKTKEQMQTDSVDRYRLFCMEDFLPANVMEFQVEGGLTGHWMSPDVRASTEYENNKPEYILDVEMLYQMTIDSQFLAVEKEYKAGQKDFKDGQPRLWAAEAMARGRAVCTDAIKGCAEGIPANPPMILPGVSIRVNKEKTTSMVKQVAPLHWPLTTTPQYELLLEELDNLDLDIMPGLRQLTSAEDGYIGLKPMTKILIKLVWQVNPVYNVNKWTGTIKLTRWLNSISALDISFQQADYTMKSAASVRIIFEIDAASQRFQELPLLSFSDFLALLGAMAGYTGLIGSVLFLWQKAFKPFGLVDFYYADNEYANVVDRWYATKMMQLGFEVPDKEGEGDDGSEGNKKDGDNSPKSKDGDLKNAIELPDSLMQEHIEKKLKEAKEQEERMAKEKAEKDARTTAEPEPGTPTGHRTPDHDQENDPLPAIMDKPPTARPSMGRGMTRGNTISMMNADDDTSRPVARPKRMVSTLDEPEGMEDVTRATTEPVQRRNVASMNMGERTTNMNRDSEFGLQWASGGRDSYESIGSIDEGQHFAMTSRSRSSGGSSPSAGSSSSSPSTQPKRPPGSKTASPGSPATGRPSPKGANANAGNMV